MRLRDATARCDCAAPAHEVYWDLHPPMPKAGEGRMGALFRGGPVTNELRSLGASHDTSRVGWARSGALSLPANGRRVQGRFARRLWRRASASPRLLELASVRWRRWLCPEWAESEIRRCFESMTLHFCCRRSEIDPDGRSEIDPPSSLQLLTTWWLLWASVWRRLPDADPPRTRFRVTCFASSCGNSFPWW
jgi:hypothetical protein